MAGPGTHLGNLIKTWLRVRNSGCGNCQALLAEMDANGPEWVRANLRTIMPRIRANARKNRDWKARILARIPGARWPIRALVLEACRRAEADGHDQQ